MRVHEIAIQNWLYSRFFVRDGFPVPVVFATPMAAFAQFKNLWADANNPFKYLLDLKDSHGTPLYEPTPNNLRYPLISVSRRGFSLRPNAGYSIHPQRRVSWLTDNANATKNDLGEVRQYNMPMAWNFRYQIDHFCNRPDTQAIYAHKVMSQFWRGPSVAQSWIKVVYPPDDEWRNVRITLDGDQIETPLNDPSNEGRADELRTTINITVEGWVHDLQYKVVQALWFVEAIRGEDPLTPQDLVNIFGSSEVDLRVHGVNPVLEERPNLPPDA